MTAFLIQGLISIRGVSMRKLYNLVNYEVVLRVGVSIEQRIETIKESRVDQHITIAASHPFLEYRVKVIADSLDLI